jgi:hypothetical protein
MIKNNNFKLYNLNNTLTNDYRIYNKSNYLFMLEITKLAKECLDDELIDNYIHSSSNNNCVMKINNLLKCIQQLINKHKVFDDYKKYTSYLTLQNLLKKIDTIYLYKILESKYKILQEMYETKCQEYRKSQYNAQEINVGQNVSIKEEYFHYIKCYGIPMDGIFLPSLLVGCKVELIYIKKCST